MTVVCLFASVLGRVTCPVMNKVLYKSILPIFILALVFGSAPVSGAGLSVISSDRSGFHAIVDIDPARLDSRMQLDSLPAYFETIQLGLPAGAVAELTAAAVLESAPFDRSLVPPQRLSSIPHALAELSERVVVRGRSLVAVRVYPVLGSTVATRVEIEVSFTGGDIGTRMPTPDPLFNRIFQNALANYEDFVSWPVPQRPAAKPGQVADPFAAADTWYRVETSHTGLCRINGSQLEQAGLLLADVPSRSLRLFNGGGLPLPVDNDDPRPTLEEVAIIIRDGGDGIFNSSDYILFFSEAVDRWQYFEIGGRYFLNNLYDDANTYWLTTTDGDGLRMSERSAAPGGTADTTVAVYDRWIHVEQDNMLRQFNTGKILDYFNWYWSNASTVEFSVAAPGIVGDSVARVNIQAQTFPEPGDDEGGYVRMTVNGLEAERVSANQYYTRFEVANFVDGLNEVRLSMQGSSLIKPYLDFLNINYPSYLVPSNDRLDVFLGYFGGTARLELIDAFSAAPIALDVSAPLRPTVLTGYERGNGLITLDVTGDPARQGRYWFGPESAAASPLAIEQVTPADLYTPGGQADLVVITAGPLIPALDDYLDYRRSTGYTVAVVAVEDIMDSFAFGLYDPTAIRDFLKYAYEYYPAPAPYAVLFVGDANYDYLDHLGTGMPNYVPAYLRAGDQSASDDNYVYFGRYGVLDSDTSYSPTDRGFDMLTARWPVRSASEINTILAKLKLYESAADLGAWRSRIALVADDEEGEFGNETFHVTQTQELSNEHVPPELRQEKIYLWDYPRVGRLKPSVNDQIVGAINDGTLLINYVGHGNPDVWAHERVFTRDGDLPRLNNADRLPLVFAASCAIGFFDDPGREGMAEDLLVHPSGGAVAVVSATRLVYSSDNSAFNRQVFDILLDTDSLSMAEALFLAKLERQYNGGPIPAPVNNDRAYHLFGDPFVRLGLPRLRVEFDASVDSLVALGRTTVSGTVLDRTGSLYNADGRLVINVYDSDRQKQFRLINDSGVVTQKIDYTMTGPSIFRGTATISGGHFDFEFITPLDIGYGGTGARIMAYAQFDATDGMGAIDSLAVSADIAERADSTGPDITYTFPEAAGFVDGGVITANDRLVIGLSDSSGINLAGGIGHGITLQIDDRPENTVDLTSRFEYAQDDFTRGELEYRVDELQPGRHTFKIKAWDNANNSSAVEFSADFQAESGLALLDLLNYPNPMQESTRFSYRLTQAVSRVSLDIFTLSGRKIRSFERFPTGPGYYDDIVWYGEDFSGDRVATGVYIFKATAVAAGGDTVESFGKVVVIN